MAKFANKRPESPKGKVWTMFQKQGEDAARKLASKLQIANSRVNAWLRGNGAGFEATASAQRVEKPKPKPKKSAKKAKKPAPKKPKQAPKPAEQVAAAA